MRVSINKDKQVQLLIPTDIQYQSKTMPFHITHFLHLLKSKSKSLLCYMDNNQEYQSGKIHFSLFFSIGQG